MSDGFLGRWSRRKLEARSAQPPTGEPAQDAPPAALVPDEPEIVPSSPGPDAVVPRPAAEAAEVPPPTLEDVQALTPTSDFSRFAARDVTPEVKNAAMKRLFADPRYNVMDGMDVYVGDYSKPDPIASGHLRQLASAQFLGLVREEAAGPAEAARLGAMDVADNPKDRSVAHCDSAQSSEPDPPHHADPDLRLQQDHAAPGRDPGHGAG